MKVNILGTDYEIVIGNEKDYPYLEQVDGFCDASIKRIVVRDCKSDEKNPSTLSDLEEYKRKVTRHEIIHAYLSESGLQSNFEHANQWGHEETMIDWIAIQFPKILKTFEEIGCLL